MSSEESGDDECDTIIIKPLLWRAPRVETFFRSLDETAKDGKSSQSIRQMKQRVLGEPSQRSRPQAGEFPSWSVRAE